MNLAELIERRRADGESLRAMAQRAANAGHPISHVQLGEYAKGAIRAVPSEATRQAIAAALGVSVAEVTAVIWESIAPAPPEGLAAQHAQAFLRLTEGRTEDEIRQTLGAVEAVLLAMDASRRAALREVAASREAEGEDAHTKDR